MICRVLKRVFCVAFALFLVALALALYGYHYMQYAFYPEFPYGQLVGAVDHDSARIWVRAQNHTMARIQYVKVGAPLGFLGDAAISVNVKLRPANEFIGVAVLRGLEPETEYTYRVLLDSSSFSAGGAGTFKTFPDPSSDGSDGGKCGEGGDCSFKIVFGSCLSRAFWPIDELWVMDWIKAKLKPDFMIVMGDLVYSDLVWYVPYRISFRQAWHQVWADRHLLSLMGSTPSFLQYDDHEILDNWNKGMDHPEAQEALKYFYLYGSSRNPPAFGEEDDDTESGALVLSQPKLHYYTFSYGRVADFFVLDTRGHRAPNTLVGPEQMAALKNWLLTSKATLKVIVSPVSMGDLVPDCWGHAQHERADVLRFIYENKLTGVFALSGDSHWGAIYHHHIPDTCHAGVCTPQRAGDKGPDCEAQSGATGQCVQPKTPTEHSRGLWEFSASPFVGWLFAEQSDEPVGYDRAFMSGYGFHFGELLVNATANRSGGYDASVEVRIYGYLLDDPKVLHKRVYSLEDLTPHASN